MSDEGLPKRLRKSRRARELDQIRKEALLLGLDSGFIAEPPLGLYISQSLGSPAPRTIVWLFRQKKRWRAQKSVTYYKRKTTKLDKEEKRVVKFGEGMSWLYKEMREMGA
jgi:hypothetical protein